ncbi:MAG: capsular polysaccharide synthesis protein [Chitinispirillia bacterium]|nr:capsular polysaccharide synthesis protein [Chitinispirillia bacterium]
MSDFFDKIKSPFTKAEKIFRRMKKARKAKKDICVQIELAKKLDGYITDFLNGNIERFVPIPKKPELIGKKIIWQYWHQGINENTPKIVLSCLDSVKKYRGEYEIIILTEKTLNDYVDFPCFIWEKLGKNGFKLPKLANLIRLYLLCAYGGVWLDSTIFLTNPIDESMLQKDFFAFQRSQAPPGDAKLFNQFDPLYFSWDPRFQVRMLNSFMIAGPNNKICGNLLSILLEYWKREELAGHYFFKQICFNRMVLNNEWKNLNCTIISDTDCHKFLTIAFQKFDKRIYDEIAAKSVIHKLSINYGKRKIPAGSFFGILINENVKKAKV